MLSEAEGEVETSPGRVPLVYNYVIAVKVLDEMSLSRGSFDCAQDIRLRSWRSPQKHWLG